MTKKPVTTGNHPPDPHHSDPLLREVRGLIEQARDHVAREANSTLTMLYWKIGESIRSEVLKNDRAIYGQQIVASLSQQLVPQYGGGFNHSALTRMINFSEFFPDEAIVATLSRQLS